MTRRAVLRGFLAAFLGRFAARRASASLWSPGAAPRELLRGFSRDRIFERRYRVDAAVTFCGVTIFTRRNVGGAHAAVETGGCGKDAAVGLHFAAGSDPTQCAGLNRFGILQEAVIESAAARPEFAFAGLITDSKEEDLEAAKKALHSAGRQEVKFARGAAADGRVHTWTETVDLARPCTWMESAGVLAGLAGEAPRTPELEVTADATPFLAAMRGAALSSQESSRRPFLHAGKLYSLELRRRSGGERDGLIRDHNGAKSAEFRVRCPAGDESGLPDRIEYRAKPYLRLVFEADERVAAPSVTSIFPKEAV